MSGHSTDTARAVLNHAARVIATRDDPDRQKRVDIALPVELRHRIGDDLAGRFEGLLTVALAAVELIALRRRRDTLIALARTPQAQKLGGQIAGVEDTIMCMIGEVASVAPNVDRGTATTCTRGAGRLKDRANARARELAPIVAAARASGCKTDKQVSAFLNARGEPPMGTSATWTPEQAASLRRRLVRLGPVRTEPEPQRRIVVRSRRRPEYAYARGVVPGREPTSEDVLRQIETVADRIRSQKLGKDEAAVALWAAVTSSPIYVGEDEDKIRATCAAVNDWLYAVGSPQTVAELLEVAEMIIAAARVTIGRGGPADVDRYNALAEKWLPRVPVPEGFFETVPPTRMH